MLETTIVGLIESASRSARGLRLLDLSQKETFLSYRELGKKAQGTGGGLEQVGVRPGDRVAIVLPTGAEFFHAFYGALRIGAVPVPLYPPVRLGRLDEYHQRTAAMLAASEARWMVTSRSIGGLLGRTVEQAPPGLEVLQVEELPQRDTSASSPRPDDLALIQFSSGTASSPKPVRLTHRQILANVGAIRHVILEAYPESPDLTHVGASWLPLYHDMGLVGSVLTALAHPSDLVLLPPEVFVARPSLWLRAISRYRVTVSAAPNFAYGLCAERVTDEEMEGVDLTCWRVALNGAEPVTPSVLHQFAERFRAYGFRKEALTPVYGLAEAALAVTFSDLSRPFVSRTFDREVLARDGLVRPSSTGVSIVGVGRALPGFAVRIVDSQRQPISEGRLGIVHVRGPSIMEGYHGQPDLTREVLCDGWLDTGDTGFLHEGHLFLFGREKDLIVLRGRNYAAGDIEQSLDGVRGVRRGCWAAVGLVPDGGAGEQLFVFVERARTAARSADEAISRAVRERVLSRTGVLADRVMVLDPGTLPRTSSGKIRRSETKKQFLTGGLHPPQAVNLLRLAREIARSRLAWLRRRVRRET